jgi:hypothetical protein
MTTTILVKRGIEFRPDLYNGNNRSPWLDAVGREIESKGLSITVGEGAAAKQVTNAATLVAAYGELQSAAKAAGSPLRGYLGDLVQALDDVVKPTTIVKTGDAFDFSVGSDLSKALGLADGKTSNYASSVTTDFGKAARTRPENTLNVAGVMLAARASAPTPGTDLSKIPHMSTQTMANAAVGYGRDGEEVEDTRVVTGISKDQTVKLATDALGDLQRPRAAAGLTVGIASLDEMLWDSDVHALRRANPYVSFTLDSRSTEVNPNSGLPRVAVGRDFFFDTFMAKKDPNTGKLTKDLQKAELMYRARIRYGSDRDPFDGTRVLIGVKRGTSIDAQGTKHAAKTDSRTDSPNQQVFDSLLTDAQNGKLSTGWGGFAVGQVPPASATMYRAAVQAGITDKVGNEDQVLMLEPAAVARQIRGRFHLNETSQRALVESFANAGEPKIRSLLAIIEAGPAFAARNGLPNKAGLGAQANALLDRSAIVASATAALTQLDPTTVVDRALIDKLWPGQALTGKVEVKQQRAVVDAIRQSYDNFAENIDELQRNIAGNGDRLVRDAGSANDVRNFLRTKAAVSAFMAYADDNRGTSKVVAGDAATYKAYADTIVAMADGRPKTELLQAIGVGQNQLRDMTVALFASPVKVDAELAKQQTFSGFVAAFAALRAAPTADAWVAELAAALGNNSPLGTATNKNAVLDNIAKNLLCADVEVMHRMVEGAGSWAQATWFNNYRETMLGVDAQSWNFVIGSMDYTEFYDAKTGNELSFADRVKRTPLPADKMLGAMLSNDFQIELEAEEGYTAAVQKAQVAVNGALGGLLLSYALANNVAGVTAADPATVEHWFAQQLIGSTATQRKFITDMGAYAKAQGSNIDVALTIPSLQAQENAIRTLTGFAKQKNPTLSTDRVAVEAWFRQQAGQQAAPLEKFLTEIAQYASDQKSDIPLSPNLLRTLDFKPFLANAAPITSHAELVDNLATANEIWSLVKKSVQDLSTARGAEVQRVMNNNGIDNAGWEPPTKAKGDYGIDLAVT